jgi:uncharacterized protein (TIGR01777 family)
MNILITGGTGFIGSELVKVLLASGHKLTVVTRNRASATGKLPSSVGFIEHDLNTAPLNKSHYENIDAIVNLAGESIDKRWSDKNKKIIWNSRIVCSRNLMANCPFSVKTVITASAIGFYGDRRGEELTETSIKGKGFLADLCEQWEKVFKNYTGRLVIIRFGMVLSRKGGALRKIAALFKKNIGAPMGDGMQWMSYISLDDLVEIIKISLENENIKGTYNAVNNHPISNSEFSEALSKTLNVFLLPAVPRFVLKLMMGEMSELLVDSQKVRSSFPYQFKDNDISALLQRELNKKN